MSVDAAKGFYESRMNAATAVVRGLLVLVIGSASLMTNSGLDAKGRAGNDSSEERTDRPPDRELQRTITHRLKTHDVLAARALDVEVENGRVTLRGKVGSAFEKTHAFFLATVPGVTEIENRIEIEGDDRPDDQKLRSTIEKSFQRDLRVVGALPRIQVKDGVVTLRGTVDSREAKQAATDIVRQVEGVKQVRNHLEVEESARGADR